MDGVGLSNLGSDPILSDATRCWDFLAWYPIQTSFYAPFNEPKHQEPGFPGYRRPHIAWSMKRSKRKEPGLLNLCLYPLVEKELYREGVPVPTGARQFSRTTYNYISGNSSTNLDPVQATNQLPPHLFSPIPNAPHWGSQAGGSSNQRFGG